MLGSLYLVLIAGLPSIVSDLLMGPNLPIAEIPIVFLAHLILPGLVFLTSYIQEVKISRTQILDLIESDLNLESDSDLEFLQSTQLASYLHNNLANEYRSISRRIDSLSQEPSSPEARRAIEQLGALINRSISEDFKEFYDLPIVRLEKLPKAWEGILELNIQLPNSSFASGEKIILVTQIIEELVSNTAAHLDATKLDIEVMVIENEGIKIIAENNGRFLKKTSQGMGEYWIQSMSVADLKEEQTTTGYKVTILI